MILALITYIAATSNIGLIGFPCLVIYLFYLCWKQWFDSKNYDVDDFYVRKDYKSGKHVLGYKKFLFDVFEKDLDDNDYKIFSKDLYGKRVRKISAKRVQNYLLKYKASIENKILKDECNEDFEEKTSYMNNATINYKNKSNRKKLLVIIIVILLAIFLFGSWFIWDVIPNNRKLGSYPFIIGLGIVEFIIGAFVVSSPYFQNFKDFDIKEKIGDSKKLINIRYKDYEFEFLNKFDIKLLNKVEKAGRSVSWLTRHKIKRFYKYALLNILNKPIDLRNIEQYESIRRATKEEILEYREILSKRQKRNKLKDMSPLEVMIVFSVILSIVFGIIYIINFDIIVTLQFLLIINLFNMVFGIIFYFKSPYFYIDKKCKKARKILNILDEENAFIIKGKVMLYKYNTIMHNRRSGVGGYFNKFCIYEDAKGNYIKEWFWDGKAYGDAMGINLQEFPTYPINIEEIYIIKNNDEIIVDRKI